MPARFRAVVIVVLFTFFGLPAVQAVSAQSGNAVGVYLGTDISRANQFAGLQGRIGIGTFPLQLAPSFEASFSSGGTRWQLNADVLYNFGVDEAIFSPYLGAGLGVVQDSGGEATDVGPNVLGGARLVLGPIRPFAQARITAAGGTTFSVAGGILLRTW